MHMRELQIRYAPLDVPIVRPQLSGPGDSARLLFSLLDRECGEVFGVLLLDTKHHLLAWAEVARGGINRVGVEPRDVFRAALLGNATTIILAHNHPSGDPQPSPDDIDITRRMAAAGLLVGIDVADHVIVGNSTAKYFSFKETGSM
jgi:DNA repair protein RadC